MKSMTGFGRGCATAGEVDIEVEVRSVNNRGLDVRMKVPREILKFETKLAKIVKGAATRGRVEVSIRIVREASTFEPQLESAATERMLAQLRAFVESRGMAFDIGAKDILRTKEFFSVRLEDLDEETVLEAAQAGVEAALQAFADSRGKEGAALQEILLAHVDTIEELGNTIAQRLQGASEMFAQRLRERVKALDESVTLDAARLAQEVALLAEKVDVTEEINRLHLHEEHARSLMRGDDAVGRKLDFLCQEFLREANTIASKCQDATAAHLVVDLKAEVERLREQVQNVE